VVAIGFRRGEIDDHEKFALACGEPIIIGDPEAAKVNGFPWRAFYTTSRLSPAVMCAHNCENPLFAPNCASEFARQIRKAIGFLRDENKNSKAEWEIDFWDRTAVPLCAITQDGRAIACASLI
jgi:hypothetical protein